MKHLHNWAQPAIPKQFLEPEETFEDHYLQVQGTAMGLSVVPNYANVFMDSYRTGKFELDIFYTVIISYSKLIKVFYEIDDIFLSFGQVTILNWRNFLHT